MKPVPIQIDPAHSIPITCPACSAPLGTITAEAAGISQEWERERIPLAVPHVDPSPTRPRRACSRRMPCMRG